MPTSAGPDIVQNGLVLDLDAADRNSYPGTGTIWNDLSGNNTSGSLINGLTFNTGSNGYMLFDGVDDKVGLGNYNQNNNSIFYSSSLTEFTLEIAFTVDGIASNPGSLSTGVQSLYRVDAWTKSELQYINASGSLNFIIGYDTPVDLLTGSLSIVTGSWYYGTLVFKKTQRQEIYLNGSLYASRTPTVTGNYGGYANSQNTGDQAAFNLGMGHPSPYSTYFKGKIGLYRWYTRALSATEIQQNYNAQKSRFGL
jgi:hypothetical protein